MFQLASRSCPRPRGQSPNANPPVHAESSLNPPRPRILLISSASLSSSFLNLPISEESTQKMLNSLSKKAGNLASTVWQNANIDTAKAALGTAGTVASGVGSTIYKQAGTVGSVAGGIGSTILKQTAKMIVWNQKLKETFACYHIIKPGKACAGTIHFTRNEIIFSTEEALPEHIKNTKRALPLLPPGIKSWIVGNKPVNFQLAWGSIKKIKTGGDTKNPSERYIEIIIINRGYHYMFKGFRDHQRALAHLNSLLESSSWS